jgi:hypothetical protein
MLTKPSQRDASMLGHGDEAVKMLTVSMLMAQCNHDVRRAPANFV